LGSYQPLAAEGKWNDFVAGFSRSYRNQHALTLVPRRVFALAERRLDNLVYDNSIWKNGKVTLPGELVGRPFRNIFTGASLNGSQDPKSTLELAEIFQDFPVALLISEQA
jgi:maltooligosyltrehalose synthase